jgi:hypothetical protein
MASGGEEGAQSEMNQSTPREKKATISPIGMEAAPPWFDSC